MSRSCLARASVVTGCVVCVLLAASKQDINGRSDIVAKLCRGRWTSHGSRTPPANMKCSWEREVSGSLDGTSGKWWRSIRASRPIKSEESNGFGAREVSMYLCPRQRNCELALPITVGYIWRTGIEILVETGSSSFTLLVGFLLDSFTVTWLQSRLTHLCCWAHPSHIIRQAVRALLLPRSQGPAVVRPRAVVDQGSAGQ